MYRISSLLKIDFDKKWKISIIEKTIQSLDGFLNNDRIEFTNGEILVKDLISLYKKYDKN